jgi:hypothetical protein
MDPKASPTMKTQIFVGEWSERQGAFHTASLDEAIATNLRMAIKGIPNDWSPICTGRDRREVNKKLDLLRFELRK